MAATDFVAFLDSDAFFFAEHLEQLMNHQQETGADFVSIGALTHSAPAIDLSFEIEPVTA